MRFPFLLWLTLAATPAQASPPSATPLAVAECDRLAEFAPAAATPPDLQGIWDFTMDTGPRLSRGHMALGPLDGAWAGSLTPYATNSLAIRRLDQQGPNIRMVVASREGDVVFTGTLAGTGNTMCGSVAYHGGRVFPMIARQRQAQRSYAPR